MRESVDLICRLVDKYKVISAKENLTEKQKVWLKEVESMELPDELREEVLKVKGKITEQDDTQAGDILKEIDWKGLEDYLSKLLGTKITVKTYISKNYVKWEGNEELVDLSGIFKAAFESVKVKSFNTMSVSDIKKENVYWCTIHLCFVYKDGGTNGAMIATAWYDLDKKGWTFEPVE